ncbi:MAG: hypothetical protein GX030_10795 [Firmicutes bacterium]|nr:hypothetical protein [Bacillota bacterium]
MSKKLETAALTGLMVMILFTPLVLGVDTAQAASIYDWQSLLESTSGETTTEKLLVGIANANLGQLAEAFEVFSSFSRQEQGPIGEFMESQSKVLEDSPDDLVALNVLAYGAYVTGNTARSIALLEQIIARDPENVWPRNFVALLYGRQGDFPTGMTHLRQALKIEPGNQYTHLLLAWGYKEQKQMVSALYHYLRSPDAIKELKRHDVF